MQTHARIASALLFAAALAPAPPATADEKFPFYPSLLNTSTGKPVASTEFEDPGICMGCHPAIYKQWNGSMHSNAFVDPVFQGLWRIGIKETNGAVEKLCAGCHTAIGTVAEEVRLGADGVFQASEIAKKGVQCDLCHTIKATREHETPTREPQNASIVVDPGPVKRGPYKDADSPYHETAYSELHTKSEFCANCHNVFHPSSNFPIEDTYREWKTSVYAQAGIQCQDCHMMPVEKAIETAKTLVKQRNPGTAAVGGPQREQVYTHEFVGANAVVTDLLGAKQHAAIGVKRLQNAASVALELPAQAEAGRLVQFRVKVRNETAGHNLPTSLTDVRQVWLDVAVTAGERELFRSGRIADDGSVDPQATMFHAQAVDKDGHHTVKPWEIVRFESNTTIPPKGLATVPYGFELPADAKGPLKVAATLRYRSFDQGLAKLLLGETAPTIPVIDMVTVSGEIALP
ncbi:MAG TPA: multiheme c-type cytochrome [Candidatus Methanoperedens sp.]|nr:multiheme c-type cytochrome [Candidatus Methanoperedens sp.]